MFAAKLTVICSYPCFFQPHLVMPIGWYHIDSSMVLTPYGPWVIMLLYDLCG